jgi:hypothetical protein
MSAAFFTAMDVGNIMGNMSWINGNKDAILFRYPLTLVSCMREIRQVPRGCRLGRVWKSLFPCYTWTSNPQNKMHLGYPLADDDPAGQDSQS